MHTKYLFILLAVAISFASCKYENEEEAYIQKAQIDTTLKVGNKGLVAYFSFNHNLNDSSNNQLILNFEGTPVYAATGCKPNSGSSLELDGASSFSFFTGVYDTLTICFWMKSADQLNKLSAEFATPTIFDYGQGAAKFEVDGVTGQTLAYLSTGNIKKTLGNGQSIIDTYLIWNFVCIEITEKGFPSIIYWNPENSKFSWSVKNIGIDFLTGTLRIGRSSSEKKNYFKGSIDELKIFSRHLDANEINALKQ